MNLGLFVQRNDIEGFRNFLATDEARRVGDLIFEDVCRDAISLRKNEFVQLLLENGLNPEGRAHASDGSSGLVSLKLIAVKVGNLVATQLLFQASNDRLKISEKPLISAVSHGQTAIVQFLLENGVDANHCIFHPNKTTLLGKAALDGESAIVDLLIQHGADVYDTLDCMKGVSRNAVRIILDYAVGVDIEGVDCLRGIDVSGFNFIGVSVRGKPVTRRILDENGLSGVNKALVNFTDTDLIDDEERKVRLKDRVERVVQAKGRLISEAGVVNLVPLACAAKVGDFEAASIRLTASKDPNQVTKSRFDPKSAIEVAAQGGFLGIVRLLAEHSEIIPQSIVSANNIASRNGHRAIAGFLSSLQHIDDVDEKGNALIHYAAGKLNIDEIKRLLAQGADINLENGGGFTPLAIVTSVIPSPKRTEAVEKAVELISFLLERKADPNKYRNVSPLAYAVKSGCVRAVELLLPLSEKKSFTKEKVVVPWYHDLIFFAYSTKASIEILTLLKEYGADLNAVNHIYTLLSVYILNFPFDYNERNGIKGFNVPFKGCDDRSGSKPEGMVCKMIEDAKERYPEALRELMWLLSNGADPQLRSYSNNQTALHVFIQSVDLNFIEGAPEHVIDCLIEHGAEVNTPDSEGLTPLHYAVLDSNVTVVNHLIKRGAALDARNNLGRTPLHLAAFRRPHVVKCLLDAGADRSIGDLNGVTPVQYVQTGLNNSEDPNIREGYLKVKAQFVTQTLA